jgi:HEAT repeat protein
MKFFKMLYLIIFIFSATNVYSQKYEHPLMNRLKTGYFERRIEAIRSLGYAKSKTGFWYYVKYLNYEPKGGEYSSASIRMFAAESLGRIADKRAVPFLLERYKKEKDELVKERLIYAFRFYNDKEMLPFIAEALKSKNKDLQFTAILTAAEMRDQYFLDQLDVILKTNKDEITKCAAIYAICLITGTKEKKLVDQLRQYLVNIDPLIRYAAANYLSRIKPVYAIKDLRAALKIENSIWVKREIERSLVSLYLEKKRLDKNEERSRYYFINYESDDNKPEVETNKESEKNEIP